MLRFVRAMLGDTRAQLAIASDSWLVPEDKQNRRRALYWARRAARSSNPRARQLMDLILLDPRHSETVRREIVAAFETAAKAGDVAGQYSLAVCYEEGNCVPKDLEKALFWYTTAAAAGDRDAELAVCSVLQKK